MRLSVRAAVPAAALLLAGCAGGSGADQDASGASAADAVARAVEKTEGVTSLHYKVTGSFPERGRIADEGTVRTKPVTAGLRTANLSGAERGETELRLVDGVLYGSATGDMVEEMGGRHWISYGPAAHFTTHGGLRMDVGALRDSVTRNPAREAAFLAGAPDAKRVGDEEIDGTGTTHYTGTAAVDELRASLDEVEDKSAREGRRRSLDQYEKAGVDELTLDVWIDGDDRVRRLRTQGFGRHGELDLTVTFLDYGKPVTVRAPRPGDTADLRKPLEK
ncbi:LppX_LprAFG lipoprotein [Streptomyces chartreusis]|uniref:LppX_LprAFG lipoprotein n=1 Tax=Streptomyces chartreusis TaxID=1969 RepID=UPI0033C0006B